MRGWKTWLGALLMGASTVAAHVGQADVAGYLLTAGQALAVVGIGHKIEKHGSNVL